MKVYISYLFLICCFSNSFLGGSTILGQTQDKQNSVKNNTKSSSSPANKLDTIFRVDKRKMVVKVIKVNPDTKLLQYKAMGKTLTVPAKEVSRVVMSNGKVYYFSETATQQKTETSEVKKTTEPKSTKAKGENKPVEDNSQKEIKEQKPVIEEKLDTIIRLGGKKIVVKIQKINASDITYKNPGSDEVLSLRHKDIERIIMSTGRKETFNKPVLMMIDETQWEAVLITETKEEVDGLYERGFVTAESSSDSRSMKAAKKSATIRLQKKAANMKAGIVLITKSEAKGGYGEIPGYLLEGIAYGFEPLPDEKK